jgi:hypothetical protein
MDALADAGEVWEAWGGLWGGHIGDPVHFESADAQNVLRQSQREQLSFYDVAIKPLALGLTSDNPMIQAASMFLSGPVGAWSNIAGLLKEMF